MYIINRLVDEKDFIDFCNVVVHAYPGMRLETEEQRSKFVEGLIKTQEEDQDITTLGLFQEGRLLGGMKYYNFNMKLLTQRISVGGLGMVAVDFLHKKEKIAKTIVEAFIMEYKNKGTSMVMLYPFRPDFYKKMGFGYGASMYQYKVKPENLPKGPSKSNISFIHEAEIEEIVKCYNRAFEETNGLTEKFTKDFTPFLKRPQTSIAAYKKNGRVDGYIVYMAKPDDKNFLITDLVISHMIFHSREALLEIMTFLNSQSDQIRNIIFNLQDSNFRYILDDPTNGSNNLFTPIYHEGSVSGTGIMYRVVDVEGIFKDLSNHNFNNISIKLKLTIKDTLIPTNNKSLVITFNNGRPSLEKDDVHDVEVAMDIADFSSLIAAAVDFKSLYKYGRANISDADYLIKINNLFYYPDKPICLSLF